MMNFGFKLERCTIWNRRERQKKQQTCEYSIYFMLPIDHQYFMLKSKTSTVVFILLLVVIPA
jgi:hypothetical protein